VHYSPILHKNAINSINTVEKVHHHSACSAKAASHNENAEKKLSTTKKGNLHQHTRINPLSNFVFAFKMDFFSSETLFFQRWGKMNFQLFCSFAFPKLSSPARKKGSKEKSFIDEKLCLLCGEIKNATNYRLMKGTFAGLFTCQQSCLSLKICLHQKFLKATDDEKKFN
jgi:hypothetical protein